MFIDTIPPELQWNSGPHDVFFARMLFHVYTVNADSHPCSNRELQHINQPAKTALYSSHLGRIRTMRLNFNGFLYAIWTNRILIKRLTEREVLGRYRGSFLGLAWSFLNPLAMLVVYTFVFTRILNVQWGSSSSPTGFAMNLFAGLIVFYMFAEVAQKSPGLILANPNYVKKVVFPLEILAAVTTFSAFFHAAVNLIVLLVAELFSLHQLPFSALWIPFVWLPLMLGCLSMSWFLSALGVYIRDIGQLIGFFVNTLMFLTPIFYSPSALPQDFQLLLLANPLAQVIHQTREIIIVGSQPSLAYLVFGVLIGCILCELAFHFFRRAKKGFADVL
jgi:lipopolysaccharide transport system permease protein